MAHNAKGLISDRATLELFAQTSAVHMPITLCANLVILPLREADLETFLTPPFSGDPEDDYHLSEQFIEVLCASSRRGTLMYFENLGTG